MKRPPSTCRKCKGFMERRVPVPEPQGARYYKDADPFLRLENIEIHRYVCLRCGHFETIQFDPMKR